MTEEVDEHMLPVYMVCLVCSEPLRLASSQPGRANYRVWAHEHLNVGHHMHNAMPAPSLIEELVTLAKKPERK